MQAENIGLLSLFAVYLGGRAAGCNIELHDVVFVVTDKIDNAYQKITDKWFGDKKNLHIDSYMKLNNVDGYRVKIAKEPPMKNEHKLFFVNFGGYQPNNFGETHEMAFYVGSHKNEIRARAKRHLGNDFTQPHVDDSRVVSDQVDLLRGYSIDDIGALSQVDGYYLHLEEAEKTESIPVYSGYVKIQ